MYSFNYKVVRTSLEGICNTFSNSFTLINKVCLRSMEHRPSKCVSDGINRQKHESNFRQLLSVYEFKMRSKRGKDVRSTALLPHTKLRTLVTGQIV